MAKAKKTKIEDEEIIEQHIMEDIEPTAEESEEGAVEKEMPKIYIPDIPAQMIVQEPKQETEIQFLYKILQIQENGGFGRHLDRLILDRIKSLS